MRTNPMIQKIALLARDLFLEKGFEETGMRDISAACGISLGNINYYFRRKEDILIYLHNIMLRDFYEEMAKKELFRESPWSRFLSIKLAYLLTIARSEDQLRMYLSASKIPEIRTQCVVHSHGLLTTCFESLPWNENEAFLASATACGGEIEVMCLFAQNIVDMSFEDMIVFPLDARMQLAGVPEGDRKRFLQDAFPCAEELHASYIGKYGDKAPWMPV